MIIGHQTQWQYLKKLADSGKVPHAFLFSGEEKIGKKKVAVEFAKEVCCLEEDAAKKPCGKCVNCLQIEKGIFPDFQMVRPDNLDPLKANLQKGRKIQIYQVRQIKASFNLGSYDSPFKIAVIDEAHTMNSHAQNSLLKLLEEPKGNALFILVTPFPKMLLPTIVSRVQILKFAKPETQETEKFLTGFCNIKEAAAREIVELSDGKPGLAIDLAQNPKKLEDQRNKLQDTRKIIDGSLARRFSYAKFLSEDPLKTSEMLDFWTVYFRKILLSKLEKGNPVSKTEKILDTLRKISFAVSNTNANPRLALEILMLEI